MQISQSLWAGSEKSCDCFIQTQEEANQKLQEKLDRFHKLSQSKEVREVFQSVEAARDYVQSKEGCPRALKDKVDEAVQKFTKKAAEITYPPDLESCVALTARFDEVKAWVQAYEKSRGPRPGLSRLPEVCVTGKLVVEHASYESTCKTSDRTPSIGISSQNEEILNQVDASAREITQSSAQTSAKPSAPHSRPQLLSRKALSQREKTLVERAVSDLKSVNSSKLASFGSMGELLIHSELNDADTRKYPASSHADYLENWQAQVAEYKRLFATTAGKPIEERLEILYRTINTDFTRKYDNNDQAFWNRPGTRMIDFLEGEGANCQGAAKLNLAVLASVVGDQLPRHLVPAAQITKGHVEAVLYDTKDKTIWKMRSGGAPQPHLEGELYHPGILLRADLFSHREETVSEKDLIIARPENAPQVSISSVSLTGTPEQRALPSSEYGVVQNTTSFDVISFSGRNEKNIVEDAEVSKLIIASQRAENQQTNDRKNPQILQNGTELHSQSASINEDFPESDFTLISPSPPEKPRGRIGFMYKKDLDTYAALKTPQERLKFFADRARMKLQVASEYFEKEGYELLKNPAKWNDPGSMKKLISAQEKLVFAQRLISELNESYQEYPLISEISGKLALVQRKIRTLIQGRPEVIFRALHQTSEDQIYVLYSAWEFSLVHEDLEARNSILDELIETLNRMPEVRVGKNGKDTLEKGETAEQSEIAQPNRFEQILENGMIPTLPPLTPSKVRRVTRKNDAQKKGGGFSFTMLVQLLRRSKTPLKHPWKFSPMALGELEKSLTSRDFYKMQDSFDLIVHYLERLRAGGKDDLEIRKFIKDTCPKMVAGDSPYSLGLKKKYCR